MRAIGPSTTATDVSLTLPTSHPTEGGPDEPAHHHLGGDVLPGRLTLLRSDARDGPRLARREVDVGAQEERARAAAKASRNVGLHGTMIAHWATLNKYGRHYL